jgi:conjugative relaxase-like TrwC/TraI family protein
MVTAKTQYNLKNAKEYFEEHLCVGDYYDEGQKVTGQWFGVGAEKLGLSGKVGAEAFLRLCENLHPASGEALTQRHNTIRVDETGSNAANRRIFYDFTISPPKSVSVAALVGADNRILEAHAQAVRSAMKEFEAFATTRVRVGKANCDRSTGNFVAATFTHDTSRALATGKHWINRAFVTLDSHCPTHSVIFL